MYDGNLLENKQFAYNSIYHSRQNEISQDRENINTRIDDDLDTQNEYVTALQVTQYLADGKANKFRSTGFANYGSSEAGLSRSQTTKTKFRVKSMLCSNQFDDPGIITFGSTKNIRIKMSNIDKSINKLHSKRKCNWSKKDLKTKYLTNGNNFRDAYNRSTNTLLDFMKTQQANKQKAKKASTNNPSLIYPTGKIITTNGGDPNSISLITNALNIDQKLSYFQNREGKYAKTETISREKGGQTSRGPVSSTLGKDFNFNTESKLRIHELKRPQTSAVNHSRDKYDPITRSRVNQSSKTQNGGYYKMSNKSQTISAFAHLGRIQAPNFSKEYQKAYTKNQGSFKRGKGMCSEVLNGAHTHAFIAKPFGSRC